MPWIESHTVLSRHRKLKELARALRLRPAHTMGHLHALWHAALEQAEDGDLSSWSDEFIAESSDFPGDAPQYVRLLQEYGWLDRKLLHDWLDYAGAYLIGKYHSSHRAWLIAIWKKHGKEYGRKQLGSEKEVVSHSTLPNLTLPNLTNQTKDIPPEVLKDKTSPPLPQKHRNKTRQDPLPCWAQMIDHMAKTWERKKPGAKFSAMLDGRSCGLLRPKVRAYMAWGIMALWDIYLATDDKWYRQHGYDVVTFIGAISRLVDDPRWKVDSKKYETELSKPETPEQAENQNKLTDVLNGICRKPKEIHVAPTIRQ